MRAQTFRDHKYFTSGFADRLPQPLVRGLKEEAAAYMADCAMLTDLPALYRAQGAAAALNDLIDVLENGVPAPAPDAGISDIPWPAGDGATSANSGSH